MKQTVTAENPWAFLEAKSSEGKMQLFRWLTCDPTHQWWHPARIHWDYLHLKVQTTMNCSDLIKNMYRNVWKGIHYLECYFLLLQKTNSNSESLCWYSNCSNWLTEWLTDTTKMTKLPRYAIQDNWRTQIGSNQNTSQLVPVRITWNSWSLGRGLLEIITPWL